MKTKRKLKTAWRKISGKELTLLIAYIPLALQKRGKPIKRRKELLKATTSHDIDERLKLDQH